MKTAVGLLVDRSGSMNMIRSDAEGAVNAFLDDQAKLEDVTVRLDEFDDRFDNVFSSVSSKDTPRYRLSPRGMTRLRDAIGNSITQFESDLSRVGKRLGPDKVIMVIVTDGGENDSREYSNTAVKDLVSRKTEEGWEFIFLAADQETVLAGINDWGFKKEFTLQYDTANYGSSFGTTSDIVAAAATTGVTRGYTDEERKEAVSSS